MHPTVQGVAGGRRRHTGDTDQGANTGTVDNITKEIYNQVGSLIAENDNTPDLLARLLDDLTQLGRGHQEVGHILQGAGRAEEFGSRARNAANVDTVDTSSFTSDEGNSSARPAARLRYRARHRLEDTCSRPGQARRRRTVPHILTGGCH